MGLILVFVSCNSQSLPKSHTASEPKYRIGLKVRPGDKYYYTISGDMESRSQVKDRKIEAESHSDVGLIYEVLGRDGDSVRLRISYDSLHIRLKNGELEKDVTARKGGKGDAVEDMLGNLLGSQLVVTLDTLGNVRRIEGGKELSQRILSAIDAPGTDTKQIIRQQMEKVVGVSFIRNTMQEAFNLFPDTALYVGDTWKRKAQQSEDVKIASDETYTFASMNGNIARVEENASFSKEDDGNITVMGREVPTDIEGEQRGHYELDTNSGMLLDGETRLSLDGTLHIMGMDVPVKVKTAKKISGKKI